MTTTDLEPPARRVIYCHPDDADAIRDVIADYDPKEVCVVSCPWATVPGTAYMVDHHALTTEGPVQL